MPFYKMKVVRAMLSATVGLACLFIGDDASLIAQAHARAERALTPLSVASAARRPHHRALLDRTIPLDLGYSAGPRAYYGYAPGTYGGVGCYRSTQGELVCP